MAMAFVAVAYVSLSTGPPTESATVQVEMVGWTDTELQEGVKDIWDEELVSLLDQPTTLHQVIYGTGTAARAAVVVDQGGDADVRYHLLRFHSPPLGERTLIR